MPQKGDKERLVELAAKNASMVLVQDSEQIKREELRTIGAMNQVGSWINSSKGQPDSKPLTFLISAA